MISDATLNSGYLALKSFGVEMQPIQTSQQLQKIGDLQNRKIVPWSYNILVLGAVVGVILSVSAYVLKQTMIFPMAISATLLIGLGAYEIKRLSLTEREATQIESYREMINLFIVQVKRFSTEKKELDQSTHDLKTQIDSLTLENQKIEQLSAEINSTHVAAEKQISEVKEQSEAYKLLNTELQNEIQLLNKTKSDLLNINNDQKSAVEQFKSENEKLTANLGKLKEGEASLQKSLEQYKGTNQTLQKEQENIKKNNVEMEDKIRLISDQNKKLETNYEDLEQAHEKLKEDLKKREAIETRFEETTAKLEKKIQKLSDVKKLKLEYEQKLKEQEAIISLLKNEQSVAHTDRAHGIQHKNGHDSK